jgi:hypothetical protein
MFGCVAAPAVEPALAAARRARDARQSITASAHFALRTAGPSAALPRAALQWLLVYRGTASVQPRRGPCVGGSMAQQRARERAPLTAQQASECYA